MIRHRTYKALALTLLIFIFSASLFVVQRRGIPFVTKREQWTIGIIRGKTPFSFTSPLNYFNPVFRAEQVTDITAKFVADPFLMKEGKYWYLFFEAYNNITKQGDLAVATSTNGITSRLSSMNRSIYPTHMSSSGRTIIT
jgi:hypothetical protein